MDREPIRKAMPASRFSTASQLLNKRLLSETSARRGVVKKSMDLVTLHAMIWKIAAV